MIYKTFFHRLVSGENAKFTIIEESINGEIYYFAKVVSTDLEFYKEMSKHDQDNYLGVHVTNGRQSTIYYKNPGELEIDIRKHYGKTWLESEI